MKTHEYKMIHPETGNVVHLEIDPGTPASSEKYRNLLLTLWSSLSDDEDFSAHQKTAIMLALAEFGITFDEAYSGLWQAYADPYVANGRIQFRHLWKAIHKKRQLDAGITYHEALRRWHEQGCPGKLSDHYENFQTDTGQTLWRPKKDEQ